MNESNEFFSVTETNNKKAYIRKSVVSMIEPAVTGRSCVIYIGTGGDNIAVKESAEEVMRLVDSK